MAKQWKCARCSTKNDEGTLTCSNCRMIRGAVVVKSSLGTSQGAPQGWPWSDPPPPAPEPRSGADPAQAPAPPTSQWVLPSTSDPTTGRGKRRLAIPALLLIFGVVGAVISNASPDAPAESTTEAESATFDMHVGDCLDIEDTSGELVSGISARRCDREHEYEVIFTGSATGASYPSESALDEYFDANCVPAFEGYVGEPFDTSVLDIFWLVPNEEGWLEGDRAVQCLVYHPQIKRLTESLKGAGLRTASTPPSSPEVLPIDARAVSIRAS